MPFCSKPALAQDGLKTEPRFRDESGAEMNLQANRERAVLVYNLPHVSQCTYQPLSIALCFHDVYHHSVRQEV